MGLKLDLSRPSRTVVLGRSGLGKSFLVKDTINKELKSQNIIVFDTLYEYDETLSGINRTVWNLEGLKEAINESAEKKTLLKISVRPTDRLKEEVFNEVAFYVEKTENVFFIIEEVDYFCSAHYTPDSFNHLIQYGRHKNISLIGVSRRFADISRKFTAQMSHIATFRQVEPIDVKLLKSYGWTEAELRGLPDFRYLEKDV